MKMMSRKLFTLTPLFLCRNSGQRLYSKVLRDSVYHMFPLLNSPCLLSSELSTREGEGGERKKDQDRQSGRL
jgi:hypothetical protein